MLHLEHISFSIGERSLLDDVNLHIRKNEIHAILGQNGTGKTTLGSLLMGLSGYKPEKGRILLDGTDITEMTITERAKAGLTMGWQRPVSFEGISVEQYLRLSCGANAQDYRTHLFYLGLDPQRYLHRNLDNRLSGGERKRIELAALWAMKPKVAILDEPDSGIDVISLERIADVIRKMRSTGTTVILITHREEIANIADRASSLCNGHILKTGTPQQIIRFYHNFCRDCGHVNELAKEDLSELYG